MIFIGETNYFRQESLNKLVSYIGMGATKKPPIPFKKMTGIYGIQSPSGKIYIGQSWDIETRFKYYKSHKVYQQPALSNSINKYGFDSHELKVLHELPKDITQEVLDRYEVFYMQTYKDAGFVLLNTKEGGRGGKHNESTKKILSEQRIGVKKSEETKKKMSAWQKGRKRSAEDIEKMRLAKTGMKYSEEARKNMGRKIGSKLSEESKKQIGDKQRGKIISNSTRLKLSKSFLQLDLDNNVIKLWTSAREAERVLGLQGTHISACAKGKRHTCGGFKWAYA